MKRTFAVGRLVTTGVLSLIVATRLMGASVESLASQADVVLIGTVKSIVNNGTQVTFDIHVEAILKGSGPISGHIVHNWERPVAGAPQTYSVAFRGLWFLVKADASSWDVLKTRPAINQSEFGLYLPVAPDYPNHIYSYPPGAPLLDAIMYDVAAGLEIEHGDLGTIGATRSPAVAAILQRWLQSPDLRMRVSGLASSLYWERDDAISALAAQWPAVKLEPDAKRVVWALRDGFRDTRPGPVSELVAFAARSTGEIREAAVNALASIHSREALPFLAGLLQSSDDWERMRGVFGLSSFANGCVPQRVEDSKTLRFLQFGPSPYRTKDTEANFGRGVPEGVAFWQSWWNSHPELH